MTPPLGSAVTFELRLMPGGGFSLSSRDMLSIPLLYDSVAIAISHAQWCGMRHITTLKVFGTSGKLWRELTWPAQKNCRSPIFNPGSRPMS